MRLEIGVAVAESVMRQRVVDLRIAGKLARMVPRRLSPFGLCGC
jgi:hypothetical protein